MEAPLPTAPTTIGEYTLGPLLGRGGMSEVYACTHARHGAVALKLLHDDADGAFHVESAARNVRHPSVVRVLDAGLDPATRRHYIVMERLDGPDLATHLAHRPLAEHAARALFAQIADGMHAVHAHGIVHRDLKPANVMLHAGSPRVVDFGIAKILGENAALVTSRRIGTLGYMAPEQLVGGKIAPSVDVWALGVMLFEAVTGRLPFDGFTESYTPQLVETAPRTSSLANVSPAYDALVAACLDADPARRPSMTDVARVLRGEVAIESAALERVTQDIGAMPSAPAAAPSMSPRAPMPMWPPPSAPTPMTSPSMSPPSAPMSMSSPSPGARTRTGILVGGIAAAVVALAIAWIATRAPDVAANAERDSGTNDRQPATASERPPAAPLVPGPAASGAAPAAASDPAPAVTPDDRTAVAGDALAPPSTTAPTEPPPAARPASRAKDRPAVKSPTKRKTKRTTTRRETLD